MPKTVRVSQEWRPGWAVTVPEPFARCFPHYVVGAISPLVILAFGPTGTNKSRIAHHLAIAFQDTLFEYEKDGKPKSASWRSVILETEVERAHSTFYGGNALLVAPSELTTVVRDQLQKLPAPLFLVIDSVSPLGASGDRGKQQYAGRWWEVARLLEVIYSECAFAEYPVIVLMTTQARVGPAVPGTTITSVAPALSKSLFHRIHVVVRFSVPPRAGASDSPRVVMQVTNHSVLFFDENRNPVLEQAPSPVEASYTIGETLKPPLCHCFPVTVPVLVVVGR